MVIKPFKKNSPEKSLLAPREHIPDPNSEGFPSAAARVQEGGFRFLTLTWTVLSTLWGTVSGCYTACRNVLHDAFKAKQLYIAR